MTYQSSFFSQMDRQTDRQTEIYTYISEYVHVEQVKRIQYIIGQGPLRHKNVASTGALLKHIMGNELNNTIHFNIHFYI